MAPSRKEKGGKGFDEKELTIIKPAYNEEGSIAQTVLEVHRTNPEAQVIVVNDGSKDGTGKILDGLNDKPYLSVVTHPHNKGYGAALKTGFRNVKTPFFGFLDADLTYDPASFPALFGLLKERALDCVWSNRFGGTKNEMPRLRKVGNRIIVSVFWVMTGKNIGDCTSGQRLFRTSALQRLDFESLPDGLDFITSLSKRTVRRHLSYATIPLNYRRREGSSKLNVVKDFLRMTRNVVLER